MNPDLPEGFVEAIEHRPVKREGFVAFAAVGLIVGLGAVTAWTEVQKRKDANRRTR